MLAIIGAQFAMAGMQPTVEFLSPHDGMQLAPNVNFLVEVRKS